LGANATAVLILVLLPSILIAQSAKPSQKSLLQKAKQQYLHAQELETALNDKPAAERTHDEYIKVIKAYQRVYLITPRTGYADNALMTISRLYEEIQDTPAELRALNFLVREYPSTPFRNAAERDIARLEGVPEKKLSTSSVENIRYWEAPNSVRVVVDLSSEVEFKQGEAKSPDRVFIDIAQSRLNAALAGKPLPVKSGLLQQIRVGQYDVSTVRVVLDVGTIGRVTSFALHDPERLIIDVLGGDSSAAAPPVPPVATPEPAKEPVKSVLNNAEPPAPPKPAPPPIKKKGAGCEASTQDGCERRKNRSSETGRQWRSLPGEESWFENSTRGYRSGARRTRYGNHWAFRLCRKGACAGCFKTPEGVGGKRVGR